MGTAETSQPKLEWLTPCFGWWNYYHSMTGTATGTDSIGIAIPDKWARLVFVVRRWRAAFGDNNGIRVTSDAGILDGPITECYETPTTGYGPLYGVKGENPKIVWRKSTARGDQNLLFLECAGAAQLRYLTAQGVFIDMKGEDGKQTLARILASL